MDVRKKKIKSILSRLFDLGVDYAVNKLCSTYNIQYGVLALNIIRLNPIELAISILAVKMGVNKIVLGVIIAFLL